LNGFIRKLKDNLGNVIFPVTPSSAIYMPDGQMNLDEKLTNQDNKIGILNSLNTQNKTDLVGAINENVASLKDIVTINIKKYSNLVTNNDWTLATKTALEYLKSIGGGKLFFPVGTSYIRNVIIPSNVEICGIKGLSIIKAKDVFYTTTSLDISIGAISITVNNTSNINIGDVITVKDGTTDLLLVTDIVGNNLTVEPLRINKLITETYSGCKYAHSSGSTIMVMPQIFFVTQTLSVSNETDSTPYTNGTKGVKIHDLTFIGSKNSNDSTKENIFELLFCGAIFGYRTTNFEVTNCEFFDTY
jgi:hypothetical protein